MIIARNCGLLTDSMKLFDLTGSKENVSLQLEAVLDHSHYRKYLRIQEYNAQNQKGLQRILQVFSLNRRKSSPQLDPIAPFALILDGISVDQLIRSQQSQFVYAMRHATTVICSRMSPKQKSRVILLMKKEGLCCLAIGDGANDVSMIRESSVGVGVKGKEGNAAVNNADYIIRKFHHLIKLLFVHGRNNYRGNSYSVYIAFYENITFNIPLVGLPNPFFSLVLHQLVHHVLRSDHLLLLPALHTLFLHLSHLRFLRILLPGPHKAHAALSSRDLRAQCPFFRLCSSISQAIKCSQAAKCGPICSARSSTPSCAPASRF